MTLGGKRSGGPAMRANVVCAFAFWIWSAFVTFGAGFVGAGLNCEGGEGCKSGSPSWLQPWTWDEYYVFPETLYVGLAGLGAASAFVVLVAARRPAVAAGMLAASLLLLAYPFFGGLTASGQVTFALGPLFALVPLWRLVATSSRDAAC